MIVTQSELITTAYSLMNARAEDAAAGRLNADDTARLMTGTLLAAFTGPAEHHQAGTTLHVGE